MKNIHKMAPDGTSLLGDALEAGPSSASSSAAATPLPMAEDSNGSIATAAATMTTTTTVLNLSSEENSSSSFAGAAAADHPKQPAVVKMELGSPLQVEQAGIVKPEEFDIAQPLKGTDESNGGSGNGDHQELVTMTMEDISRFAHPVNSQHF